MSIYDDAYNELKEQLKLYMGYDNIHICGMAEQVLFDDNKDIMTDELRKEIMSEMINAYGALCIEYGGNWYRI